MLQTKPLRSSTFRLTLAYLGLFGLSSTILLIAINIMTARFNDLQVRTVIEEEVAWLRDQSQTGGIEALERLVAERSAVEPNRRAIYLLVNPLGGRLAGNLSFWPNAADRSGYVRSRGQDREVETMVIVYPGSGSDSFVVKRSPRTSTATRFLVL